MKPACGDLLFLLPVMLFLALAAYFARALRPDYDPHELPSALMDKEAPRFDLAGLKGDGIARDALEGRAGADQLLRLLVRAVPGRASVADARWPSAITCRSTASTTRTSRRTRRSCWRSSAIRIGGIGLDRDGRVGLDFGVYGVPETYVLDSDGHIRKRFVGPLTAQQVEKELLPLLKALRKS